MAKWLIMKMRFGFVSNSSTSSFIVQRFKDVWTKKPKKLLTKKQEKLLDNNGFVLGNAYYPHQVDMRSKPDDPKSPFVNWVKDVTCNQNDEIEFLLKNRLSFTSSIHYENWVMIYDGETDKLLIAQNWGEQALMQGSNKFQFKPSGKGVELTTGKDYLNRYKN